MSWQKRLIGVLALGVLALWPLSAAAGTVGLNPCDGLTMFVKEFEVLAGTTITGVAFENNDARTVFPEVLLVRGDGAALSQGTTVAQAGDVQETADGWVQVIWATAVSVTEDGMFRVGVRFPEGSGKLGDGNGPGVGAVRVAAPAGSFVAGGTDRELTPLAVDLQMNLITSTGEAGKAVGEEKPTEVTQFFLGNASPNPFNPSTAIKFGVDRTVDIRLSIYDVSGREVRRFVEERLSAGTYQRQWNGRDDVGRPVAAGVYVLRLTAGERLVQKKITLLK